MSLPFQQKILRVVECGTYTRAGGNQAKAACALGLEYHQYRYFLKKFGD